VTLDGQLIEATGTMSGGGAKKMSGAMKSSRGGVSKDGGDSLSESELANLSNSHDALVEQLKNLKLKHRQLEQVCIFIVLSSRAWFEYQFLHILDSDRRSLL
jgi:chromosome segregation ATPase